MGAIITLSLLAILVLYLGLYKAKKLLLPVSVLGMVGAAVFSLSLWNEPAQPLYNGMVLFDHFSIVFTMLMIGLTILVFLLSRDYFDFVGEHTAEYLALMLFSLTGALLIVSFYNLSMLFIGIEIMSVALYILAGIRKSDYASNEASLKYFLMGAFSTGFLLFGIALIYGASGSFGLAEIQQYVLTNSAEISPLFYTGVILFIIGLAFKIGAAPFHFWVPDVYDGSPILITTFMSTIVKVAAIAAFLRLFWFCFEPLGEFWMPVLSILSIVTLFVGNITALMQQSFKRMLAYSSISHVGYMLFALLSLGGGSANAILIYGGAYSLSSIVAFAALIAVKRSDGSEQFEAFHGLARKNPFLSFTLAIAMLSLAGIPLTAGFVGKFMMFTAALNNYHLILLIIAVINAGIGIYYYFRVIVAMYFRPMEREEVPVNLNYKIVIAIATVLTILLGIYPAMVTGIV